ncbi:uncharacterized protein MONOS_1491 [Monocercomonoides exilis]|uniref:uncharacterized protein n=1 Tax=Monocercomonoides exilis TaxID=2049356 RepID=UPI0035598455|nr:hypothetical protein MONOS_1491 [Monocercomonoides exilis]|eukprot:MONOS_1491.1-p1 / transcript=MONOS_1491.1 / gene=MONOS_1491 / organism=Monocercomonoides_exilis_PA203 / gene_product=unspecified product / transcript_product=unspecified product / location=Mono_scaffold00026:159127-159992(-) / protein_length=147 / sequence_SO=supercontig / SO=protein_coding / is_pseudo=false
MAQMVVEALGMSGQKLVKARTETEASACKKFSVEPEVHNSSPSDGIQQEISEEQKREQQTGLWPGEILMQHGTKREAGMKQAIVEDLAVMFFALVEWCVHKAEEFEFVRGIIISQDELIHLANEHIVMKSRLLRCGVTASVVMEYR